MNRSHSGLRDVLSALAVVASLVFVGLEIRQNTAAQRSQTRQAISDTSVDFLLRIAENPEFERAWSGSWYYVEDGPPLTAADSSRASLAMIGLIRHMENVYLQYQEGVFDQSVLNSYGFRGGIFTGPQFREYWQQSEFLQIFDTAFVRAFEEANDLR